MNIICKTVIAAAATLALSGTASASTPDWKIAFSYSSDAPVETTYHAFEKTAKKACRKQARKIRNLSVKRKFSASCRAELIEKAVSQTQNEILLALHETKVGTQRSRRIFASRN